MKKIRGISIIFVFGVFFWLLPLTGEAATTWGCDCSGSTIQSFINNASVVSGDTILVSGICNENIDITKSGIIIDGNGAVHAEIHAPDAAKPAVMMRAHQATIKNFNSIQGGVDGVYVTNSVGSIISSNTIRSNGRAGVYVFLGGAPTINGNTITNNASYGILLLANAYAFIINNTITSNLGDGIYVTESSAARIGFASVTQTTASPNTITSNGRHGIVVYGSSNALIVGNTISNNTGNGLTVGLGSHVGASANTIDNNGGDGIEVVAGSGISLGSDTGTGIFERPNETNTSNGNRGLECSVGGYVDGRLGTLNGINGKKSITRGCVNSLIPPY
jgi:parallel beta-helix repeat protein